MKTILIVDDSESIRQIVSMTLEKEGYNVLIGNDGIDALELMDNNDNIDLLLTDLHMPNMNGICLIKKVRIPAKKYSRIPILFLTTETQMEMKMEAKQAGATGWIIKPFIPKKLLMAVKKVIR